MTERRPKPGRRAPQTWTARICPCGGAVPFLRPAPRLWFLDLDDTLLASSGGLLHEVHLRMNAFLTGRMGMSEAEANRVREKYWREYGSTFIGLWRLHGVDPREFLPEVHDFDYAPFVRETTNMRRLLGRLPGRRVLFTNGPRLYAERLLPHLGLEGFFDEVLSSTDMRLFGDWRPKPDVSMLLASCARLREDPRRAVLVDDSLMNLKAAKAAGMRTVWCVGLRRRHARLAVPGGVPMAHPAADAVVRDAYELVRIARSLG